MTFQEMINSDVPVLVDFTAAWCGPCQTQAPVLEEVKKELGETAKIIKVDIDRNPQVASQYQIQSVPTLMIFKNGIEKYRRSGVHDKRTLVKLLQQFQ